MKKISGLESALCEIVNGSLYHLSLREIVSVLRAEYGIKASHETVRKWVKKLHLDSVQTIEVHHKILRNKNTNVIEIAKGIMYYLQDTPELVCSYLKFILKEQYGIELSASTVYLLVRDLRATGGYDSVQKDGFVFTLQ